MELLQQLWSLGPGIHIPAPDMCRPKALGDPMGAAEKAAGKAADTPAPLSWK